MTPLAAELRGHVLFRALGDRELAFLAETAEIVRADGDKTLIRAGDRVEALYLLREGETLTGEPGRRSLPGDFFFTGALAGPVAPSETWRADTPVTAIRIAGERFRFFLERFPGAIRRLRPRTDGSGRLVSGLPEAAWLPLRELVLRRRRKRIGPVVHWSGRQSPLITAVRMFLPASAALLLFTLAATVPAARQPGSLPLPRIYAAGGILAAALSLLVLIRYFLIQYRLLGDSLEIRRFSPGNWTGTRETIPLDRILGSEIVIKGLVRRAFGIGTLRFGTAAEGVLAEFRDIDRPLKLRNRILALAEERRRESAELDKSGIRRAVEEHYGLRQGFTLVSGISDRELGMPEKAPLHEPVTFRKSRFVLVRALALPAFFLAASGGGIAALLFRGGALLPVLLAFPGAVAAGALGVMLWRWLDWRNDLFRIEEGTVIDIDRKPFGRSESRKQVALTLAQNIAAEQRGFLAWLFDFGDVTVTAPGGGPAIRFESVSHPAEVQRTLFRARELWLKAQEHDAEEKRVQEILNVTDAIRRAEEGSS